ncbi:hypothetical protein CF15_04630 [Pyrodictium occultum]|uniref:Cobalt ABC transporter permease n=1 Tax=Pyrodictium occultum TaxID=2309 RepID=A0A0V8RVJ9_PYROC|nr:hypothetical protein CF15_04630 [Pyrodictium occultum]
MLDEALAGFLSELREAALYLAAGEGPVEPRHPGLVFLLLVVGVALVSYSPPLPAAAGLLASMPVLAYAALSRRGPVAPVVRSAAYVVGASALVALPLLPLHRGSQALLFLLRVSAASAMVASVAALVGWRRLAEGLGELGLPGEIVEGLSLVARYVPLLASEMLRLLAARRARSLGRPGLREAWRLLAGAAGELLERSMQRATLLGMAIEARSLSPLTRGRGRGGGWAGSAAELLAYLPPAAVVAVEVAALLAGC